MKKIIIGLSCVFTILVFLDIKKLINSEYQSFFNTNPNSLIFSIDQEGNIDKKFISKVKELSKSYKITFKFNERKDMNTENPYYIKDRFYGCIYEDSLFKDFHYQITDYDSLNQQNIMISNQDNCYLKIPCFTDMYYFDMYNIDQSLGIQLAQDYTIFGEGKEAFVETLGQFYNLNVWDFEHPMAQQYLPIVDNPLIFLLFISITIIFIMYYIHHLDKIAIYKMNGISYFHYFCDEMIPLFFTILLFQIISFIILYLFQIGEWSFFSKNFIIENIKSMKWYYLIMVINVFLIYVIYKTISIVKYLKTKKYNHIIIDCLNVLLKFLIVTIVSFQGINVFFESYKMTSQLLSYSSYKSKIENICFINNIDDYLEPKDLFNQYMNLMNYFEEKQYSAVSTSFLDDYNEIDVNYSFLKELELVDENNQVIKIDKNQKDNLVFIPYDMKKKDISLRSELQNQQMIYYKPKSIFIYENNQDQFKYGYEDKLIINYSSNLNPQNYYIPFDNFKDLKNEVYKNMNTNLQYNFVKLVDVLEAQNDGFKVNYSYILLQSTLIIFILVSMIFYDISFYFSKNKKKLAVENMLGVSLWKRYHSYIERIIIEYACFAGVLYFVFYKFYIIPFLVVLLILEMIISCSIIIYKEDKYNLYALKERG